ncbi:DNA-protecting protein DprA [Candidatus Kaiserbacteria bacterium CG10_big_fil_rev_8_21_14_0_10_43_70]|uniref:DNA-protecting protein DprA n=1 Tax=Candidatus Kaiserbacteria bacterium CG10_big_fil_rev_8_21_14_0_10_43_70 TaxID=1974605 RepID=A0A2H0UJF6_9BACT|nr:MAG: DNA-protecting protein DprA [Candidatus Kaiserbacteria bacterium CG10_big_fil_rev_8_21_14_0_10_43_70]
MSNDLQQLSSADFPALINEIPDPPEKLFIRGTLPSDDLKWLSVVGSRKYTPYGKQVCEHLVQKLSGLPVVIVSGLAIGIDSIVHKTAIDAGLKTVAIPGSGLDEHVLYPRSNLSLSRAIVEAGGALISEFEPDFKATPWSFPQRNRIMAGISHATLLIESAPQSGTLITARLTTEYNRELLVVPHSIFNETSRGNHQFLKLGATPVTEPEDILQALGIDIKEKDPIENINISGLERVILSHLETPMPRDNLIEILEIPAQEANILLSKMELQGLITEEFGIIHKK